MLYDLLSQCGATVQEKIQSWLLTLFAPLWLLVLVEFIVGWSGCSSSSASPASQATLLQDHTALVCVSLVVSVPQSYAIELDETHRWWPTLCNQSE